MRMDNFLSIFSFILSNRSLIWFDKFSAWQSFRARDKEQNGGTINGVNGIFRLPMETGR